MRHRIILGTPQWTLNGVNAFCVTLARGLLGRGHRAEILVTGARGVTSRSRMSLPPANVPISDLAVAPTAPLEQRRTALAKYLEDCAPCIYIPNHDWQLSAVAAQLSERIRVVGIVHADDPLHYSHAVGMGKFWDAIVTVSPGIHRKLAALHSSLADRIVTIVNGVDVPTEAPVKEEHHSLRLVYAGRLVQTQKRVLDLATIFAEVERRGIPAELNVIGDGVDGKRLRSLCEKWSERGKVSFTGVLTEEQVVQHLRRSDIFILPSEFEGMPLSLLEAMAQGCVPLATKIPSGSADVIRDGVNGFVFPVGDTQGFAKRIEHLNNDRAKLKAVSTQAFITVRDTYSSDKMVERYLQLFQSLTDRPSEMIVQYRRESKQIPDHSKKGIKSSSPGLYLRLRMRLRERGLLSSSRLQSSDYSVVMTTPTWGLNGPNVFSADLSRGLLKRGIAAEILLTRPDWVDVKPMDLPSDLQLSTLPVQRFSSWPARWKAMVRYLEGHAPCIYIPNYDFGYSAISPSLSKNVRTLGIIHSDDPQHYEHVRRLGHSWDAIVAVSPTIYRQILEIDPSFSDRLHMIPYGVAVTEQVPKRPLRRSNAIRLVYTGRLDQPQKQVLDLPKIVRAAKNIGVPVRLSVAGSGAAAEALRISCHDLGIEDDVDLLGTLTAVQIRDLLQRSDVFLQTSAFEGLSISLLEAMGQGCVPLVTDIRSGVPDLIEEGVNGFRVSVGDIQTFAERIQTLYLNSEAMRTMQVRAHATILVGEYRLESMVDRYADLLGMMHSRRSTSPPYGRSGLILPVAPLLWRDYLPHPVSLFAYNTRRFFRSIAGRK